MVADTGAGSAMAALIGVFALLIGLAMLAVLVSQKAQTSAVIQALAGGGASLINAATAPVSGGGSGVTG